MMNQQYVFHTKVHRDWVDHNGHLNDAMYNRIFSDTTDDWLGHLGLTINAIQSYQYTVFTLENHIHLNSKLYYSLLFGFFLMPIR